MTDLNSLSISGTPSIVKQFRVEGSSLGDVAKFDFCRISTSPFSYSFFWLSRLAAIFFAS